MYKMFWFEGCSNPVDVLFLILLRVRETWEGMYRRGH